MASVEETQLNDGAQSPLVAHSAVSPGPADAGVNLGERRFAGITNLRVADCESGLVKDALGVELPLAANTWNQGGGRAVVWLSPDEWLVISPPGAGQEALDRLDDALHGTFHATTDQSSGYTVIRVQGERAAETLAKGCTLDLSGPGFDQGQCAQTNVAKTGALIIVREAGLCYDVVVRRSFADYLWLWLMDAGVEYGVKVDFSEGLSF
jgi:sarcosine oxidase, subunit gamma